jgi:hypothetical protein
MAPVMTATLVAAERSRKDGFDIRFWRTTLKQF